MKTGCQIQYKSCFQDGKHGRGREDSGEQMSQPKDNKEIILEEMIMRKLFGGNYKKEMIRKKRKGENKHTKR